MKPLRKMVTRSRDDYSVSGISFPKIFQVCNKMEIVALRCNNQMCEFAEIIVADSVKSMGKDPPCPFTAVAKGSLARGEATPYSDLEFFFIIEEKTDLTKLYFTHLAMTVYFMIGNLQETKLKYMNIKELRDWFDDQETSGFKIDGLLEGAGNIPTGNGVTNRKNMYIYSLQELVDKYQRILDNPEDEAIKGDDSAMLAFTKEIYSYHLPTAPRVDSLLGQFVTQKKAMEMNTKRRNITVEMLRSDVQQYELNVDQFITDGVIEVKPKIYRFPSLVILDLSVLYGINAQSSWDALCQLGRTGRITSSMEQALHHLLAMASYIRICTYLYHRSQKEVMKLSKRVKGYLVSRRIFTAVIVYMLSLKGEIVPPEKLPTTEFSRYEAHGAAIVAEMYRLSS